jgi:hypothetical protein
MRIIVELEGAQVASMCAAAMAFVDTTPELSAAARASVRETVTILIAALAAAPDLADDALERFVEGG